MKRFCSLLLGMLLAISLTGCGGGGDGDGPAGITYTGLTTQATIDENNAEDIATGAYQGGATVEEFGDIMGVVQDGEDGYIGRPRCLVLSEALEKAFRRVDVTSVSGVVAYGAIVTVSETEDGSCGGSMSWTLSLDDVAGDFTGSFDFNNYCEDDTTLSGSMSASGKIDLVTKEFVKISMTFTALTAEAEGDSFTANGDISFEFSESSITVTMNMYLRDNSTRKVYWVEDYFMSITEGTDYVEVEVSGRFYDPDDGYVVVSTPESLRIYDVDDGPRQGVLLVEGANNTKAKLTAVDSTTCRVEADTDGDDIYEWKSEDLYWSNL